jgi:hypothetical protein
MILNTAPQDQAILSNVGEIGDFKIKASAKAFSILSSGLYANKIRAIVRELSCNAVDSHVAAGKEEVPFEVHLPNQLSPHFSVRDFGTGLSHEQVTQIYTTYFESTKTDSNSFIGALGLGSKSPFSYTDNFTVTAIKDGRKGIYSAFINNDGVPSIALMMEEQTDEPAGVEVKFAVEDRYDTSKFAEEARHVFINFKLRPTILGSSGFQFYERKYESKDIIPGVHNFTTRGYDKSIAVMGNIGYPIDVPNAEKNLGELENLLSCGLEMHFAIGELDFQASREGLSYIPSTIEAIRKKLKDVNEALTVVLAKEADAIVNLWERADFLNRRSNNYLWRAAVEKYVTDSKFELIEKTHNYLRTRVFELGVSDLASKFNISLNGFIKQQSYSACTKMSSHSKSIGPDPDRPGYYLTKQVWDVSASLDTGFVINDTKVGATERAKYHWRNTPRKNDDGTTIPSNVFVLEKADRSKEMKLKEFFDYISSPPTANVFTASDLKEKPRQTSSALGRNVSLMRMEERGMGGYYREKEMVWRDAGKLDSYDNSKTYYYLPLSGYTVQSAYGYTSATEMYKDLNECGIGGLIPETVFGVRKIDIEAVKAKKNWVNLEKFVLDKLTKQNPNDLMSLAVSAIDDYERVKYNSKIVNKVSDPKSPYSVLANKFKGVTAKRYSSHRLNSVCSKFIPKNPINPDKIIASFVKESKDVIARYPLLEIMRSDSKHEAVAEYINMIDAKKGV